MNKLKRIIMDAAVLAGLISAGAGIAGTGGNIIAQSNLNKKNRQWSEQMTEKSWQHDLDVWNMQNAYNTPMAQKQRLINAGMNPLFYGLDGNAAGDMNVSAPQSYEGKSMPLIPNPAADYYNAKMQAAQIENVQADTAKKKNENLTETQRRENMAAELDKIRIENDNLLKSGKLTDAQREAVELQNKWIDRINEANVGYTNSQRNMTDKQRERLDALLEGEKIIQSKTIREFDAKYQKIMAEVDNIVENTNLTRKDVEYYILTHLDAGFQGTGASLRNFLLLGEEVYNNAKNKGGSGNVNADNPWEGDDRVPPGYNGSR